MSDPKWCPQCGAQHTGPVAACSSCQPSMLAPAPSVDEKPRLGPAPLLPAKGKRAWIAWGGPLLGVILLGALAAIWAGSPPAGSTGVAEVHAEPPVQKSPPLAAPPALVAEGIAGEYWRDTEPAGRPRKMSLCPDGRYFEYSAQRGRWSATGADQGKVTLVLEGGQQTELAFKLLREPRFCSPAGCDAEFDGSRYGRDPTLGNCD